MSNHTFLILYFERNTCFCIYVGPTLKFDPGIGSHIYFMQIGHASANLIFLDFQCVIYKYVTNGVGVCICVRGVCV